jgi:cupin domain
VKLHDTVAQELVEGRGPSPQILSGGTAVGLHYHDVEEWLTVVRGDVTFFTLADQPFQVVTDRALRIPRGEVHRAEAGPDGVEYRMSVPVSLPDFGNRLTEVELDALRTNLRFPECEDGHVEHGREFFEKALSDELVFCRADGTIIGKRNFIESTFVDRGRTSSGSVRVLNRSANGLLVPTVVTVTEGGARSFTNIRFLAVEDGKLRCRLWANYPQLIMA